MKAIVSEKTGKRNKKNAQRAKRQATIKQASDVMIGDKGIINKLFNEKKFIDHKMLQWIALLIMTIDHIGMVLFPDIDVFREVGRMAFPIFCFMLTEGFVHTHDRSKYYLRIFGAAILSIIPFNLVQTGDPLVFDGFNVMFELLFGFVALSISEIFTKKFNGPKDKILKNILIWVFAGVIGMMAEVLGCDYGLYGILLTVMFWFYKGRKEKDKFINYLVFMAISSFVCYPFSNQIMSVLSLIPIYFYNSNPVKTVKKSVGYKYLTYFYYPVHFLPLYGAGLLKELIINKLA